MARCSPGACSQLQHAHPVTCAQCQPSAAGVHRRGVAGHAEPAQVGPGEWRSDNHVRVPHGDGSRPGGHGRGSGALRSAPLSPDTLSGRVAAPQRGWPIRITLIRRRLVRWLERSAGATARRRSDGGDVIPLRQRPGLVICRSLSQCTSRHAVPGLVAAHHQRPGGGALEQQDAHCSKEAGGRRGGGVFGHAAGERMRCGDVGSAPALSGWEGHNPPAVPDAAGCCPGLAVRRRQS
jgi:hypothetical protein